MADGCGVEVGEVVDACVGSNAGVFVSVAMVMRVTSGDRVSVGAWVAPGCAKVV